MAQFTCSLCEKPRYERGWCQMHYTRWRNHGDPTYVAFIRGDNAARFWSKVEKSPTCWYWRGRTSRKGYGTMRLGRAHVQAHRFSYELNVGPIPEGLVLDHLCRVTRCVNPAHLEPVTDAVNVARGLPNVAVRNAAKTHCPQGHEYTPENTVPAGRAGWRRCLTCKRAAGRERYHRLARARDD